MYREICQTDLSEFQKNTFDHAVWQLLLYFYTEFPSKILTVYLARCG